MSLLDSVVNLGSQALGNAIGGPAGGMIADKLADFATDMVDMFMSKASDVTRQSDLPDTARNVFDTAYDAGFRS